jgi:integrase
MPKRAHGEGSLLKRKGCQIWYGQYYRDGRQIRVSTGKSVKQEALGVLRRLMGDSERGLASPAELKKITYSDLRAALIANYTERGNKSLAQRADGTESIVGLPQLDKFFGYEESADGEGKLSVKSLGVPVTRLTTDAAREFARKRSAEEAGPAMINRSLALLRRMLRIAHEDNKIQTVPKIRLLKEPPARKGFLELAKFEELQALLPGHLRPLVLFLYWCGVRLGEALSIQWEQVDLSAGLIRLEEDQTKNSEPRIVPLPSVLLNELRVSSTKQGRVFDGTNLRVEWEKACAACGLGTREKVEGERFLRTDREQPRRVKNVWYRYNGLIVHDLRRSAIRNLINAGVPEKVAMQISGHKTRSVFDRYHIVSVGDVTAAMRRVETSTIQAGNPAKVLVGQKFSAKLVQKSRRRSSRAANTR